VRSAIGGDTGTISGSRGPGVDDREDCLEGVGDCVVDAGCTGATPPVEAERARVGKAPTAAFLSPSSRIRSSSSPLLFREFAFEYFREL
jgi:hypothetical protein